MAKPSKTKYPPPPKPSCEISPSAGFTGDTVTLKGKHWKPNSTVTVSNGVSGSGTTNSNGDLSGTGTVTGGPGHYTVVFSGQDGSGNPATCTHPFEVQKKPKKTSSSSPLVPTGGMALGAVLLIVVAGLGYVHRRRMKLLRR